MSQIEKTRTGIRSVQVGLFVNGSLAMIKLVAGVVGNTYALVADAIESTADILSSLITWRGLEIAGRAPDEDHPFGHGKAESLAAAAVSLMLIAAALGIAIYAIREIRTPHLTPAPWTLVVLVAVVAVKWRVGKHVGTIGTEIGSTAVRADAWHHMSDAVTSAAAFVGIAVALIGSRYAGGSGWESADDWAALVAAGVIGFNGLGMSMTAAHDLMDRAPSRAVVGAVRAAAESVSGVIATEKLAVRKSGLGYRVTLHVQARHDLSLHDAHVLSGRVKRAIRMAIPEVEYVLVHMEPWTGEPRPTPTAQGSTEPSEPPAEERAP
jgi:cation diffusion facilitator family transporter